MRNSLGVALALLLGFGLDAYCVTGTERQGKIHMWVATRLKVGPYKYDVTYWESTTAERFSSTDAHRYATADFAFNHALEQDIAYESLLHSQREKLHARLAELGRLDWLEDEIHAWREEIRRKHGVLPDSTPLIRQMRDERSERQR